MTRRRWIYNADGSCYEVTAETSIENHAPYIHGEFQPYRSMATGEMIDGRKAHREHLKRHKLVEVGTETQKNAPPPRDTLKQDIARIVYEKLRY